MTSGTPDRRAAKPSNQTIRSSLASVTALLGSSGRGRPFKACALTACALKALLPIACVTAAAGCQLAQPRQQDRVNLTPIVVDDAMKVRQWQRTSAVYPNFSVTTGPTEFLLTEPYDMNPELRAANQAPVFVGNVALMPVAMVQTPPWAQVETTSLYVPPTYTANPPLTPLNRSDYSGGPAGSAYNPGFGRAPTDNRSIR